MCARFELFTGHKSEKNIHIYKKLGYKNFKTDKITDNLNLIYMEKTNSSIPDQNPTTDNYLIIVL
jgi:hypothetical protein